MLADCPEGQKEIDRTGECVPIKGTAKQSAPSSDNFQRMIQGFIQVQHEEITGMLLCRTRPK
jgi:hypothetical protein